MTNLKSRIDKLENDNPDKPFIAIFQDWDDPSLWHPGNRAADPISWDEAEAKYKNYTVFQVLYVDNWRDPNND